MIEAGRNKKKRLKKREIESEANREHTSPPPLSIILSPSPDLRFTHDHLRWEASTTTYTTGGATRRESNPRRRTAVRKGEGAEREQKSLPIIVLSPHSTKTSVVSGVGTRRKSRSRWWQPRAAKHGGAATATAASLGLNSHRHFSSYRPRRSTGPLPFEPRGAQDEFRVVTRQPHRRKTRRPRGTFFPTFRLRF